jgi:threonine/homoserine/homoserine lactone efflux protein
MTFGGGGALFGTMVVLAAIPSVSVLAVSARSAASGFVHGALTTLGVVLGDVVFILLAVYGLAAIAELMGDRFVLVRYLGAAYLVWLGVVLWRAPPTSSGWAWRCGGRDPGPIGSKGEPNRHGRRAS